jgi:hypothetical protein
MDPTFTSYNRSSSHTMQNDSPKNSSTIAKQTTSTLMSSFARFFSSDEV